MKAYSSGIGMGMVNNTLVLQVLIFFDDVFLRFSIWYFMFPNLQSIIFPVYRFSYVLKISSRIFN